MTPERSRHTILVVPGAAPKMLAKAATLDPDEVIFDLEDAVAPSQKAGARSTVAAGLCAMSPAVLRAFRVNDVTGDLWRGDVREVVAVAGEAVDSVVLPKVRAPEDVATVAALLDELDPLGRIGIEAQIETAAGLANAERIAGASPRLRALVLGAGDLAADLGMPVLTIGSADSGGAEHMWHYALSRIVVAARAAGLDPVDGPYGRVHDLDGLRESARRARLLGCAGKWVIHPAQLDVVRDAFTPTPDELARARRIVERYGHAQDNGVGAVSDDGELIDAASLRMAQRLIASADVRDRSKEPTP